MFSDDHGHIRLCLVLLAVLALVPALASPARAGEAYISVNGGLFEQGSDYRADYDEMGLAAGLSYIMVNEYAGFEFGLSGYTSTSDLYDEDATSLGLEFLVHFHKTDATLQPFFAFGLSRYRTTIEDPNFEVDYTGGGAVLKAGARLFMSRRVFVGVYYKKLVNEVDISSYSYDLGGDFIFGELGIVTF
jgi:hypothetical protein